MTLKSLLATHKPLVAPGVYDALTAAIAVDAGFSALYLSGAAFAYTRLGAPDIGLPGMQEMADNIALLRDRVGVPLIVDADTGFGNALNTQRTVRVFERAGASAIQLEDQTMPKRCGHLKDKTVISSAEMEGKIKAAVDARQSPDTLIIARTDAVQMLGRNAAIDRANRYAEAGADILFIEAPRDADELALIARDMKGVRPLLANMVEGGDTPLRDADELGQIGYSLVIFPGGVVRALARTADAYYRSLYENRSNAPFAAHMYDFAALNDRLGTEAILARGALYGEAAEEAK